MRHLSFAFVATLVVVAGCQPPPLAPTNPSGGLDCKALFALLDLDGNGILTEAEYLQGKPLVQAAFPQLAGASDAQLAAHLKGFDANPDGQVTGDEFLRGCAASASPKPGPSTSPSACEACPPLAQWDANGDGVVVFEEFFLARGGKAPERDRWNLAFGAFDASGDGRIDAGELCGPMPSAAPSDPRPSHSPKPSASPTPQPSTSPSASPSAKPSEGPSPSPSPRPSPSGSPSPSESPRWPLQATVNVYGPMQPFGPQNVDIAAGGTVLFNNVNSGVAWTIRSISGPGFADLALPTSPGSVSTPPLVTPGTYEYKIDGANPFTVNGFIVVH